MNTYTAKAERCGKWWALSVPEVPGALSQSRRLDQAPAMIRETISLILDVPEDSFEVALDVQLPDDDLAELRNVKVQRQAAERAQQEAATKIRALVARLHEEGLVDRDIATILSVSPQRVHQLLGPKRQAS